ncbi:hypothetical protein [Alteraurantiacibacter aquimixticola]|uniref:Uncharacterized protein n=1 Tax=Alteraurantiacibacter aquimixticola TaxID=2489173 RepID=A0A4T3F101_9SPHN|nr:hypothetical protein [Alteraurantiacibacter aquimixticola]TIX49032.1 hypothetical protein E5222_14990 [Alteraurantiacibacter aquimixticola]
MFLALASLAFAQLAAPQAAADEVTRINGQCLYPEQVRQRAQDTVLLTCNEARIEPGAIAFGLRSWESEVRFEGPVQGDKMTVERIQRPSHSPEDARGLCQFFYTNGELSTIACTAMVGAQSYAANFVVSRI